MKRNEDYTHYPTQIDPKKDQTKGDWVAGDPPEPVTGFDGNNTKELLDKTNKKVEKERGVKLKPFVERVNYKPSGFQQRSMERKDPRDDKTSRQKTKEKSAQKNLDRKLKTFEETDPDKVQRSSLLKLKNILKVKTPTAKMKQGLDAASKGEIIRQPLVRQATQNISKSTNDLLSNPKHATRLVQMVRQSKRNQNKNPVKEENEMDQQDEALSIQMRVKKRLHMRRNRPKLKRMKRLYKSRKVPEKNIRKRSAQAAIRAVRKRVAGKKGQQYSKLTAASKSVIDKKVKMRQKIVQRIAKRMLPRQRKAELTRLSKRSGVRENVQETAFVVPGAGLTKSHPDTILHKAPSPDETKTIMKKKNAKSKLGDLPSKITEQDLNALFLKSVKSGHDFETIIEVYIRGIESFNEDRSGNASQQGFARVNSFISQGAALEEDADLLEYQMKKDRSKSVSARVMADAQPMSTNTARRTRSVRTTRMVPRHTVIRRGHAQRSLATQKRIRKKVRSGTVRRKKETIKAIKDLTPVREAAGTGMFEPNTDIQAAVSDRKSKKRVKLGMNPTVKMEQKKDKPSNPYMKLEGTPEATAHAKKMTPGEIGEGSEGRRVTYRSGKPLSPRQQDAVHKSLTDLFANPNKVPKFAQNSMPHGGFSKKKQQTQEGTNLSFSQWLEAYGGSYGSVRAGNPGGKSSTTYKGSKDYTRIKADPKKKSGAPTRGGGVSWTKESFEDFLENLTSMGHGASMAPQSKVQKRSKREQKEDPMPTVAHEDLRSDQAELKARTEFINRFRKKREKPAKKIDEAGFVNRKDSMPAGKELAKIMKDGHPLTKRSPMRKPFQKMKDEHKGSSTIRPGKEEQKYLNKANRTLPVEEAADDYGKKKDG